MESQKIEGINKNKVRNILLHRKKLSGTLKANILYRVLLNVSFFLTFLPVSSLKW